MGQIIKPHYLCITSGLFFISLFTYFLNNDKNVKKNILACALFLCLVFSQLFWYNPKNNSFIHKMDARISKLSAFLFIIYTLFYKNLTIFVIILYLLLGFLTLYTFYRSDYYSNKEWCCDEHLFNHGLIHISAFFATQYAFI